LIGRLNSRSGFDDCGDENRFVNIETATCLINNFHGQKLLSKQEQEAIDCFITHLPDKTILTVRSFRTTYLCLKNESYTDFYAA